MSEIKGVHTKKLKAKWHDSHQRSLQPFPEVVFDKVMVGEVLIRFQGEDLGGYW